MNISTQVFPLWAHKEDHRTLSVHSSKQAEGDVRIDYKLAVVENFEEGDDWLAVCAHIHELGEANDREMESVVETLILGVGIVAPEATPDGNEG